jgi:hypothetical protein
MALKILSIAATLTLLERFVVREEAGTLVMRDALSPDRPAEAADATPAGLRWLTLRAAEIGGAKSATLLLGGDVPLPVRCVEELMDSEDRRGESLQADGQRRDGDGQDGQDA